MLKSMVKAGERAPEFALKDHTGAEVTLSNLLNQGPLILFFYPRDFTAVCTREACMMQRLLARLATVGLHVAGISPDDIVSHEKFRAKHNLGFTLLSDPKRHVMKMYGVNGPFSVGVRRATFLIDQNRRVQNAMYAAFRVGRHEEFLQRAVVLRELALGERETKEAQA